MPKKGQARANNGMGSIRQRPDGRWEARYTTPDGCQRSIYGWSEGEVTKKLRKRLYELDTGVWREPSKMRMSDWFGIWLTDYQGHNADRTVLKYRCIAKNHFIPVLGDLKVTAVSSIHIRRMVNTLQGKGLSPVTIKNYMLILGASFQCAIDAGIIQSNPVSGVKVPRATPTKFTVVDREDIPAFVEAAMSTSCPYELLLMLYTGLRVGELRGLRWEDCNLDAGTISVERQLHPTRNGIKPFTTPKYGEVRTIHLADEAIEVLQEQRKRQLEQRLAHGGWDDNELSRDLVFRTKKGHPYDERAIYKAVRAAGAAIGKPELHPHDLRHSYAVAALRSGVDVKTVQHNLGHKTSQMTLDVYAAYTEDAGREGASKLSFYLKNTLK